MVDHITKALAKLSKKERQTIKRILTHIKKGNVSHLDVKKLSGRKDIFRVRKGKIRIIFRMKKGHISILAVERRNDNTY